MDVLMPQLGETVAEGKISKWFVSTGDAVKPGDNLFEIETDKVSMEVPAIAAGVLSAINVKAGQTAPVGAVVAVIQGKGESVSPSKPPTPLTPAKAGVQETSKQERSKMDSRLRGNERAEIARPAVPMEPFREVRSPERNYGPARQASGAMTTPLARRLAAEAGVDLSNLMGSGPHGRIVAQDVEKARKAPAPAQTHPIANIVLTADIEITQSLALCNEAKAELSLADVMIKAWAAALSRIMPTEPSDITLVVGESRPVIRDVARKSLTAISAARRDPGARGETQDASTAIFIADVPGIVSIADVVRPPQTTMLSVGSQRRAPMETADGSVKFINMMTVTLTCDHRAVDAARGAELLAAFREFVERPVTMLV
jgi:pyruvate/2-oxoglutarate dehydrogenase complex dihydrolipoamide acyltransferase (E2) component